jgi:outer membrane protein OmpA-like peptidoglycan-associated protein
MTLLMSPRMVAPASPPNTAFSRNPWQAPGLLWLALIVVLVLAGCASTQPAPEPSAAPWQRSAQRLLDTVLAEGLAARAPVGFQAATQPQALLIKPSTDESMRREGAGGPGLASFLAQRVDRNHPRYARAETGAVDASLPRWELKSTLTAVEPTSALGASNYILALELFDPARGRVVASGRERFVDPGLDSLRAPPKTPVRAAPATPAPAPAAAAQSPAERLQSLNEEYLSLLRQNRETEAQAVFSRLVAESLAARSLNLKFLFGSASSQFWADPVLQKRYDNWLAEVARQLRDSSQCLQMVGHASRGGNEAANRRLSLARAEKVKQVLLRNNPSLAPRLFAVGLGWDRPMAGTGANDPGDAVDRRVELRVIDCP